jgi:hypothetical protein
MGIVASLAASQVAQEIVEDEARRELVRYFSKISDCKVRIENTNVRKLYVDMYLFFLFT